MPRTSTSRRAASSSAFVSCSPARAARVGHVLGLHHVEDRERGPRRQAAGRRRWSRGRRARNAAATSARAQQAPIGHAVAERLRHRDDVGAHAVGVLEPEPAAGAAEPGLDLVDRSAAPRARRTRCAPARGSPAAPGSRRPRPASARAAPRRRARRARRPARRRRRTAPGGSPIGSGWNVSCFCGWPVAASVVSVRPWKEPYADTTW